MGTGGAGAGDAGVQLPPDPAQVAPALDLTIATDFAAAVTFLFEGTRRSRRASRRAPST